MQAKFFLIIPGVLLLASLLILLLTRFTPPSSLPSMCGGFANIQCPVGYTCQLDGNYPDAGGTCVSWINRRVTSTSTCRPRPKCLDSVPKCLLPETPDMCPSLSSSVTPPPKCTFNSEPCDPKSCDYNPDQCASTRNYVCPQTEWIDCMPGSGVKKPNCDPQYLRWAQSRCLGFKGAAY